MLLLLTACWGESGCEPVTETEITFTRDDGATGVLLEADEHPDGPAFYMGDGTPDHGIITVSEELGGNYLNIGTHFNGAGIGDTCKAWNQANSTGVCGWFELSGDVVNEEGDELFSSLAWDHDEGTICIADIHEDSEAYYLSFTLESSMSFGDASLEILGTVLDAKTVK